MLDQVLQIDDVECAGRNGLWIRGVIHEDLDIQLGFVLLQVFSKYREVLGIDIDDRRGPSPTRSPDGGDAAAPTEVQYAIGRLRKATRGLKQRELSVVAICQDLGSEVIEALLGGERARRGR
jgi:hypothetical protein